MDKRLLLSAVGVAVWAQQPSPVAVRAEKALRNRVQQYYQLLMEKKYRQAEAFVAEDTRDDYYNGKKPDIRGFSIMSVELLDHDTKAKVTIKTRQLVLMMGAGAQMFEIPAPTSWKLENGQWRWYIPAQARNMTPFGRIRTGETGGGRALDTAGKAPGSIDKPDVTALQGQVSIDRGSVVLSSAAPTQAVTIRNGLPGPVDLTIDPHVQNIKGLVVEIDKPHLNAAEKATVQFRLTGENKISDVVEITAAPINRVLDIQVKGN